MSSNSFQKHLKLICLRLWSSKFFINLNKLRHYNLNQWTRWNQLKLYYLNSESQRKVRKCYLHTQWPNQKFTNLNLNHLSRWCYTNHYIQSQLVLCQWNYKKWYLTRLNFIFQDNIVTQDMTILIISNKVLTCFVLTLKYITICQILWYFFICACFDLN